MEQRSPSNTESQPTLPPPTQLFTDAEQTRNYAAHRPQYPQALYDAIYQHALPGRQPPFSDLTVLDVATGSGQALGPLPYDFGTCIALDVSAAQLASMPAALRERAGVRLQCGDAHATGLAAGSVDLVVVGQAMHWFRLEDFYRECRRILKPTGALAAWTYGFGELEGPDGVQELYEQLHSKVLGPYFAAGRKLADAQYEGMEPGQEHFSETRRLQMPMSTTCTAAAMVGQVKSWSAYPAYRKANPHAPDPADSFGQQLASLMAASGIQNMTQKRPLTLLLALRPQPLSDTSG